MSPTITLACDPTILTLPIDRILPMRTVTKEWKNSRKYRCIQASIRELGIIEPLVVFPQNREGTSYMLLDGHARLEVLKELGETTAPCLISHDDEAFTYNHKINQLTPIQEHFMIHRGSKAGLQKAASPPRLASIWTSSGDAPICWKAFAKRQWPSCATRRYQPLPYGKSAARSRCAR